MQDVQGMASAVNSLRQALEQQQAKYGDLLQDNAKLQEAADSATAAEEAAALAKERQLAAETRCTEAEDVASQVQERLGTEERLRRHLHNMIQQLKGNIRVCVRVRPLIGDETADCGSIEKLSYPDENSVEVSRASAQVFRKEARRNLFTYDKCFREASGQSAVFGEVSEFVQSAMDGKRVCVFCYGITGSGKTYTMGTDAGDLSSAEGELPENAGIVPRTIAMLMEILGSDQSAEVSMSVLEIYNEEIRDLFGEKKKADKKQWKKGQIGGGQLGGKSRDCALPGVRGVKPAKKPAAKSKDAHEICPKTGEISNLVTHTFGAGERAELSAKLEAALESRSVGATNCNEVSPIMVSQPENPVSASIVPPTGVFSLAHGSAAQGEADDGARAGSGRRAEPRRPGRQRADLAVRRDG